MSEILSLIAKLKSEGIFIALDGKVLRVESENGPINDDIRQTLKSNKPEIIRVLKENQPKPYLTQFSDLAIPFDSDPRFHWWKPGGLKSSEFRRQLKRLGRDFN